jgi:hypothetical protein
VTGDVEPTRASAIARFERVSPFWRRPYTHASVFAREAEAIAG